MIVSGIVSPRCGSAFPLQPRHPPADPPWRLRPAHTRHQRTNSCHFNLDRAARSRHTGCPHQAQCFDCIVSSTVTSAIVPGQLRFLPLQRPGVASAGQKHSAAPPRPARLRSSTFARSIGMLRNIDAFLRAALAHAHDGLGLLVLIIRKQRGDDVDRACASLERVARLPADLHAAEHVIRRAAARIVVGGSSAPAPRRSPMRHQPPPLQRFQASGPLRHSTVLEVPMGRAAAPCLHGQEDRSARCAAPASPTVRPCGSRLCSISLAVVERGWRA